MGSDDHDLENGAADDVAALCNAALVLDRQRADLDRRLMALQESDGERERSWQELEDVVARLSDVVLQLADVRSRNLNETRRRRVYCNGW